MRKLSAYGVLLLTTVVTAGVFAQDAPPRRLQFEVASVKPNTSGEPGLSFDVQPGGRLVAVNVPLKQLIRAAYTLQLYQIVGAPGWVDAERFDVNAVANQDIRGTGSWNPGGGFLPVQLMLQSLLADRFKLRARPETRDYQTYALVAGAGAKRTGLTLRPAAPDCGADCGMRVGPGTLRSRNVPLRQVAELLSQVTGRVVTDETALTGLFDLELQWSPGLQPAEPTDAPSIFAAVQEQLGLRLEARRGPVSFLVIDAIDRPTAD